MKVCHDLKEEQQTCSFPQWKFLKDALQLYRPTVSVSRTTVDWKISCHCLCFSYAMALQKWQCNYGNKQEGETSNNVIKSQSPAAQAKTSQCNTIEDQQQYNKSPAEALCKKGSLIIAIVAVIISVLEEHIPRGILSLKCFHSTYSNTIFNQQ